MQGTLTELKEKGICTNIENVVASAICGQRIDLNSILKAFSHAEHRPELFPGLVFRLKEPKTATLIFASGSMVCTGAKSEQLARKAVLKVVNELRKKGIKVDSRPEIQIQNIVASGSLGGPVELEKAIYALKKTMYEPEQFPGMIYRMEEPKVVMLIFSNGKVVCTGAKHESEVYKAVDKLRRILEEGDLISIKEAIHAFTKPDDRLDNQYTP